VLSVRRAPGGETAMVRFVRVEMPSGTAVTLVLRLFTNAEWLAREPDLAWRESAALSVLESSAVPSPELVGVDVDGSHAGVPAVLCTRLPGQPQWSPPGGDVERWVCGLAANLPAIHETDATGFGWTYRRYNEGHRLRAPAWAIDRTVWERAIEAVEAGPPLSTRPPVFVHRDYHPGNVLWSRSRTTGVIDWVNASVGHPGVDVSHCRANLSHSYSPAAAEAYLAECHVLLGDDCWSPWWDLAVSTDFLEAWKGWVAVDGAPPDLTVLGCLEAFMAAAVSQLG
jgi:aminoglycoside phosphotransferase (APT) family kinase protein